MSARGAAALMLAVAVGVSCNRSPSRVAQPSPSPSSVAQPNPVGPRMLVVEGVTVTFGGGNGESPEFAVIVHAPNEDVGVAAEYAYLSAIYGTPREDWDRPLQAFLEQGDRQFDQLEVIDLSDNSRHTFYFDITEFYGK